MPDVKCIAKYLRLSIEDEDMFDESNSITNQRLILNQYIASHDEFTNVDIIEFKDDGYSGTNFERPGFQEMMSLVRCGRISTIIVKDLSRFGRNHIEVDTYLEQIFPFMGIRFIAINDNVDSAKYESGLPGMDVGFRNIINEHHSINTSENVKSSFRQRMSEGKYMGARAPYGYIKPKEDVTSLAINPETAAVVKKIFSLYVDSDMNITQIARWLNEEGIMCPGQYKMEVLNTKVKNTTNRFIWYPTTVRGILKTETYTGKMIACKWKVAAVGSNKHIETSEEEWIIVEDAHEAIISKELFEEAGKKLELLSRKRTTNNKSNYPLKGKLVCGGCGQKLIHVSRCQPHCKCARKFSSAENGCVTDNLYDQEFNKVVFNAIKMFAALADDAEPVFEKQRCEFRQEINELSKCIRKNQDIIERTKKEKMEVYMKFALEEISEDCYLSKKRNYETKILQKEQQIEKFECKQLRLSEELMKLPEKSQVSLQSIVECEKKLTKDLVDFFVDTITVYEDHRIEIKWAFSDDLISFIEKRLA